MLNPDDLRCVCPARAKLTRKGTVLCCLNESCIHHDPAKGFKILDDRPVIISPALCDTLCDPNEVQSYVDRSHSNKVILRKIIVGESGTTLTNCKRFCDLVTHEGKKAKILVIGAGEKGSGTGKLWDTPQIEITGIDIYVSVYTDLVCDAHYLPFADACFDGVWIQAVLEHVVEPQAVVTEIHRVLKADGIVYAETPFMQQVHEGAYDYTRYTVLGHRYLFRDFEAIDMGGNKGAETVLAWSIRYFFWALTRHKGVARLCGLATGVLLRPFKYLLSDKALYDSSSGVFFMGKKSDNRIRHADLPKLYKGQF
jgi:SAM-dependent methyltransferase